MAKDTEIQWCDHTFSPWWGCSKVSAGCSNCYAEGQSNRWNKGKWGPNGKRERTAESTWNNVRAWDRKAQRDGTRPSVFPSMCDPFEDFTGLDPMRRDFFRLIESTPHLTWLLLTKRPKNIPAMIPAYWMKSPLRNVAFGTSVENQDQDKRIADLLKVPAAMRFLSMEPLLGSVDLNLGTGTTFHVSLSIQGALKSKKFGYFTDSDGKPVHPQTAKKKLQELLNSGHEYLPMSKECDSHDPKNGCRGHKKNAIDWVIVGGESGHGARPMHPDWARSIRDQCKAAGVPFFFKQWGEWDLVRRTEKRERPGFYNYYDPRPSKRFGVLAPSGEWYESHTGWNGRSEDPDTHEAYMHMVGKKAAGRTIDGKIWNEFPTLDHIPDARKMVPKGAAT